MKRGFCRHPGKGKTILQMERKNINVYGHWRTFSDRINSNKNLFGKIRIETGRVFPQLVFCLKVLFFFHFICLGWLIFRAESLDQLNTMLYSLRYNFHWRVTLQELAAFRSFLFYTGVLFLVQLFQYKKNDLMAVYKLPFYIKSIFYVVLFNNNFYGV